MAPWLILRIVESIAVPDAFPYKSVAVIIAIAILVHESRRLARLAWARRTKPRDFGAERRLRQMASASRAAAVAPANAVTPPTPRESTPNVTVPATAAIAPPIEVHMLGSADREVVEALSRVVRTHSGSVAHAEIAGPGFAESWLDGMESGRTQTAVAYQGLRLLGYASLHRNEAPWRHQEADIRIVIADEAVGAEPAKQLTHEMAAAARSAGIRKIVARMTLDDDKTRDLFDGFGFASEGVLVDHAADASGRRHDVLIMSCATDRLAAQTLPAGVTDREASAVSSAAARHVAVPTPPEADAVRVNGHDEVDLPRVAPVPQPMRRIPGPTRRRGFVLGSIVGVVAVIMIAAGYATTRNSGPKQSQVLVAATSAPTRAPTAIPSITADRVGSGSVYFPIVRPATVVRVGVDADVSGTWFWCVESSFGLPLEDHYCSATGTIDEATGTLSAQGVLYIDPSWPGDAQYFVQMFCEGPCSWHVSIGAVQ